MNPSIFEIKGVALQANLEAYNWDYRKKICSKCPLEEQKRRKCLKFKDSFRVIDDKIIYETHCNWLVKARTKKFRNEIDSFLGVAELK